jgi:hypothetical protein
LKLLKELIAFPSRYPNVAIGTSLDFSMEETTIWKMIRVFYHVNVQSLTNDEGKTMKDLRPYVLNIILDTLCAETKISFARTLFNILYVFVVQDHRKTPKLIGLVVKVVQEMIVIGTQWNQEIMVAGLMFLRDLVHMSVFAITHSQVRTYILAK